MTWEKKYFPDLYKERLERGMMRLGGLETRIVPGDRVPAHRYIRPGRPGPPHTISSRLLSATIFYRLRKLTPIHEQKRPMRLHVDCLQLKAHKHVRVHKEREIDGRDGKSDPRPAAWQA